MKSIKIMTTITLDYNWTLCKLPRGRGKLTRGLCLVSLFHSNIFILFLFYKTSWRFTEAIAQSQRLIAHYSWGEITNLMSKWYLTISPSVSVSATLSSGWWPRCSYQPKNKLTQDPKLGKTGTRKLGMFYSWVLCFYFYNSTFLLFISLDHRLLSQRCVN